MMPANEGVFGLGRDGGKPAGPGGPPGSGGAPGRGIDEARLRQQAIGVKLRQMFDQVVNEPVPQEFLDILRRGDEASLDQDEG
jgi:hypothetical protein